MIKVVVMMVLVLWPGFAAADEINYEESLQQKLAQVESLGSKAGKEKVRLVKQGFDLSQGCLKEKKQEVYCHYYAAVFRGLLLEEKQINYKKELPRMVLDFETSLKINPLYDDAGAHRALAELYRKLPTMPIWTANLVQDLKKAWHHASEGLRYYPKNFFNLRAAGDVRYSQKEFGSAEIYWQQALQALGEAEIDKGLKNKFKKAVQKDLKKAKSKQKK